MSTIAAGTTSTTALVQTADTTGNLIFQTNGTTQALQLNTSGAVGVGSTPAYGTSGQPLLSAGSGASPTWGTLGTGAGGTGLTSVGTNGQFLQSNGSSLQWATPAAGAMTLISTQTVTNGLPTWTGLSGYDKYFLVVENLYCVGTASFLIVQFGTGSTTWVTSGYHFTRVYNYNAVGTSTAGTSYDNDNSQGFSNGIAISANDLNASNTYSSMKFLITNFNNSGAINLVGDSATITNSYQRYYGINGSLTSNSSLATAIRINFQTSSSGLTGTASLYGISS